MFTFKVEVLDAAWLYFHTVVVDNVQIYRTGTDSLPNFLHQFELTFLKLVTVASQVWYNGFKEPKLSYLGQIFLTRLQMFAQIWPIYCPCVAKLNWADINLKFSAQTFLTILSLKKKVTPAHSLIIDLFRKILGPTWVGGTECSTGDLDSLWT